MKNLVWFVLGIAGGLVVAHFVNKDPRGHELLAQVDARITEFTDRIAEAYHEQDTRITGLLATAKDTAADAIGSASSAVADAVSDAVDAAQDAARKLTD